MIFSNFINKFWFPALLISFDFKYFYNRFRHPANLILMNFDFQQFWQWNDLFLFVYFDVASYKIRKAHWCFIQWKNNPNKIIQSIEWNITKYINIVEWKSVCIKTHQYSFISQWRMAEAKWSWNNFKFTIFTGTQLTHSFATEAKRLHISFFPPKLTTKTERESCLQAERSAKCIRFKS